MLVRELELDLDAFEGPFDLLLTLVLKEELDLAEVDVAAIVVRFVNRLAEREELDLDACGEFLVLVAALLELKARGLFPDEEAELAELEPEEAAEELARRLAEYRRAKEAAAWLAERLEAVRRARAAGPRAVSLAPLELRFPPVSQFLSRFRAVLRRRRVFDLDAEVQGMSRIEQAVAFLALLELRRAGDAALEQAAPFGPIRVRRTAVEG